MSSNIFVLIHVQMLDSEYHVKYYLFYFDANFILHILYFKLYNTLTFHFPVYSLHVYIILSKAYWAPGQEIWGILQNLYINTSDWAALLLYSATLSLQSD